MANKVPSMSGSGMSSLYMKYLAPHYALRRFHGDRAQLLPSGLFTGTPMGFFTGAPWFFSERQLIATLRPSRSADALLLRIRAERSRARRGRAPGLNKAVPESRLPHQDSHPSLPQQHHRQIGESALSPAKFQERLEPHPFSGWPLRLSFIRPAAACVLDWSRTHSLGGLYGSRLHREHRGFSCSTRGSF